MEAPFVVRADVGQGLGFHVVAFAKDLRARSVQTCTAVERFCHGLSKLYPANPIQGNDPISPIRSV